MNVLNEKTFPVVIEILNNPKVFKISREVYLHRIMNPLHNFTLECHRNASNPDAHNKHMRMARVRLQEVVIEHLNGYFAPGGRLHDWENASDEDVLQNYVEIWSGYEVATSMFVPRFVEKLDQAGLPNRPRNDRVPLVVMDGWRSVVYEPLKHCLYRSFAEFLGRERNGEGLGRVRATLETFVHSVMHMSLTNDMGCKPDFETYSLDLERMYLVHLARSLQEFTSSLESGDIHHFLQQCEARRSFELGLVDTILQGRSRTLVDMLVVHGLYVRQQARLIGFFNDSLTAANWANARMIFSALHGLALYPGPVLEDLERRIRVAESEMQAGEAGHPVAAPPAKIAPEVPEGDLAAKAMRSRFEPFSKMLHDYFLEVWSGEQRAPAALGTGKTGKGAPEGAEADSNPAVQWTRNFSAARAMVESVFDGHQLFLMACESAMTHFLQDVKKANPRDPSIAARDLAKYTDDILRKGGKHAHMDDAEARERLEQVLRVFKLLDDKDIFLTFFSKQLAKRLISSVSVSDEREASMLSMLKEIGGNEYTKKLQRMFLDIPVSEELMAGFGRYCEEKPLPNANARELDFSTVVLATGSWPLNPPTSNFLPPPEVRAWEEHFFAFYSSRHSGRKLTWLHHLSKAEIKTHYGGKYIFGASAYQAGVLLLFNGGKKFHTLASFTAESELNPEVLRLTLLTLLKTKVLKCAPPVSSDAIEEAELTGEHKFAVNEAFRAKKKKVTISIAMRTATKKEDDDTQKAIVEERKLLVQARIVQVMKARKTLAHAQLISEVIKLLATRFEPEIRMVRSCIDILMEKEYMKRNDNDSSLYDYMA